MYIFILLVELLPLCQLSFCALALVHVYHLRYKEPYMDSVVVYSHFINSHFVNSHFVNSHLVGIDKVGIDKVFICQCTVDPRLSGYNCPATSRICKSSCK